MSQSLFSTNWYRVTKLQPKLREAVTIRRQYWRNQQWYLLSDESNGRQHRINAAAYQFIGRCDGKLTIQQVWDAMLLDKKDDAPTQDEVIQLLIQLNRQELLQCEQTADSLALFKRRDDRAKQKRKSYTNPFALRMPFGDPAPILNRLDNIAHLLFRPITLFLWLAIVLIAILVAGSEWDMIYTHASLHMLTPRYLTITLICFPIIKALHELSHGLAVRRWGGEVHEFGLSLLVFVPAPYVDASAANAFPLPRQRMAVSAAGIIVETTLAALALIIWNNVQPGLVQDVAFVVMVIGSISTLVFNGNPLLRFDGYYVLSDLLDIPNLATRSNQYWSNKLHRLFTRASTSALDMTAGEEKWLFLYAPLSFAYRLIISLIIILWLGAKWFLLGMLAASYMAFSLLVRPVFRWSTQLLNAGAPGPELDSIRRKLSLFGIGTILAIFLIPIPFSTTAPAIVWLPEKAQVRPQGDGFVKALPTQDGMQVKTGDLLAVMENPKLNKRRSKLISKLDSLNADQFQLFLTNPEKAKNVSEAISNTKKELAYIEEKIADLNITAQVSGQLVMPQQADKIDTYVRRGDNMGYIFENNAISLRAAVAEKNAYFVRNNTRAVNAWLAEMPNVELPAIMTMDTPAATRNLPSAALGDRAGGQYVTEPTDSDGTLAVEPIFIFDLTLPDSELIRVGGRAHVRFEHEATPLAIQIYQRTRQLFLHSFEPSA